MGLAQVGTRGTIGMARAVAFARLFHTYTRADMDVSCAASNTIRLHSPARRQNPFWLYTGWQAEYIRGESAEQSENHREIYDE